MPAQPAANPAAPANDVGWPLASTRPSTLRRWTLRSWWTTRSTALPGAPPVALFRWVAIAVGLVVAATQASSDDYGLFVGAAVLVAYTAWRMARPIPYDESRSTTIALWLDALVHTELVLLTGAWSSPYTLSLVPNAIEAGFARGLREAVKVGLAMVVLVSVPYIAITQDLVIGIRNSAIWLAVLLAVSVISGFSRQLTTESLRQRSEAMERLQQLAEANALLYSLHRMAQTLPASLDLDELFESARLRLQDLVPHDAMALYLHDESDGGWRPMRAQGTRAEPAAGVDALPPPVRKAIDANRPFAIPDLDSVLGPGVDPSSRSGIYAPLLARGTRIGVLALESTTPVAFGPRAVQLVAGFVEPLGVAVDNARWFSRLHSIGAADERARIARDLHDQIGQSLAGLSFGLDHARTVALTGQDVAPVLDELRTELRLTITEVREALYDLRTDVSAERGLEETLAEYLDRVGSRSAIDVRFLRLVEHRLPLPQERELWWIAREAIANVERHSHADHLTVEYRVGAEGATMVVTDDGVGMGARQKRADSYGMVGMRERAGAIGATLDISSPPGGGTTVRVNLTPNNGGFA